GIIECYHAMLNSPKLGFYLVAFCMVGLKHQSEATRQTDRHRQLFARDIAAPIDAVSLKFVIKRLSRNAELFDGPANVSIIGRQRYEAEIVRDALSA
ncbi:hypothetical protein ACC687_37820, partial [Rhizobium ruizarguesonis]